MPDLGKLQSKLDCTFEDQTLLVQALTHRSYSEVNNERLEFLGDAVLGFVIGLALYDQFPDAAEGELSRLRSDLVRQSTLAEVARELELGDFLTMGRGELRRNGFARDSMLADSLEAVIGAMLLDGGFEAASGRVLAWFDERLVGLSLEGIWKDAKTRLQEHLQGMGEPLPEYILLSTTGKSPIQEFTVECCVAVLSKSVRAKGSTRRQAEQGAASLVLDALGVAL